MLRGGVWSTVARVLPQVYVLIISVVAARFLGPDGMGRQSFIAFVALSTTMLLTSGLSISLMRHVGEELGGGRPGTALYLVSWSWRIVLGAALLGAALLGLVAVAGADPTAAWVLAGLGASFGMLHTVPSAVLIGAQRWRDATIAGLVTGAIAVPADIIVLAAGGGITGLFAVEAVVSAGNFAYTALLARRAARGLRAQPRRDVALRRRALRYAIWSTLSVVLTLIVFRRSEFFFLDYWSADSEIALYSIAFAAINALMILFDSTAAALLPAVATLHGAGDRERIRSGYRRTLRLLSVVAFPLSAAVLALGPELVRLVYGNDYADTGPVLRVMAVVLPIAPLMYVANSLLVGLGYLWPMIVAGAAAATVNVALAFLLIPAHDAVGAALANAGAQIVVVIAMAVYAARVIGETVDPGVALRSALAAAVAGLPAYALVVAAPGVGGLLAGGIVGFLVFMVAARVLRVLPSDDAEWLLAATGGQTLTRAIAPATRFLAPPAREDG